MGNYDEMALAVEMLSGGTNRVLLDDIGLPGVYVSIPKGYSGNVVAEGDTSRVHPAFKVDGVEKSEILISKFQNIVYNNRAYSLPKRLPRTSVNQPNSKLYCTNKGKGFHLMTLAEWAYVALWSRKNGTMPHGNNNYGADSAYPHEKGVQIGSLDGSGRIQWVATGSGPETWAHNHNNSGIFDLNGNVWEWQDGMRIVDGEIQIIANNDAALGADCDTGADSTLWKAIMPDGSLVEPGTTGTLKYDWVSSKIQLSDTVTNPTAGGQGCQYNAMTLKSEINVPDIIKDLILYPDEPAGDYGGDYHYMNPEGERLPFCGGSWSYGANAGVFFVGLTYPRSTANGYVGFRSAYVDL